MLGGVKRLCSQWSPRLLARLPGRDVGKLGIGLTVITGGIMAERVRQQKLKVSRAVSSENVEPETSKGSSSEIKEKHNRIIKRIYNGLQSLSSAGTSGSPTFTATSVTEYFVKQGEEACRRYLTFVGAMAGDMDLLLGEWLTAADRSMDAGELWSPLPSLGSCRPPLFSDVLMAGVMALWHITQEPPFTEGSAFISPEVALSLCEAVEESDESVTSLALKVIANTAITHQNYRVLQEAGVIGVLERCANSEASHIFLPAWRALHNCSSHDKSSREDSLRVVYPEGVYPYVMPGDTKGGAVDVVLVHGIRGGAEWTFRQHDSAREHDKLPPLPQHTRTSVLVGGQGAVVDQHYSWCWPLDWLSTDLPTPIRVLAVSYHTQWVAGDDHRLQQTGCTLARHSRDLCSSLRAAGVGQRPIVWLTHSMGGLLAKYMMTEDGGALGKQSLGVVFLSVPHHGSPLATTATSPLLSYLLRPTSEVRDMRVDNPKLAELHQSFLNLVQEHSVDILTLNETQPTLHKPSGYDFHFVPSQFGDPGVGEFYEVNATHLDICKPVGRNAEVYKRILAFFNKVLKKL